MSELRKATTRLTSGLMAVKPKLDEPYPDDPRWTPWTRFVEDRLLRVRESAVRRDQLPQALEEIRDRCITAPEKRAVDDCISEVRRLLGEK